MIPEGRYKARAIDGGLGETSDGNPQVAVRFGLLDEGHEGEEITWFGSFSKNKGNGAKTPLERTIESLRTCGWEGDDLSDLRGITDCEVSLVIAHEEYPKGSGKVSAKVKWVNRTGGLALKAPMNETSAKAFAARMKGEVIAASRHIAPVQKSAPSNGSASHPNAPGSNYGPPTEEDPF